MFRLLNSDQSARSELFEKRNLNSPPFGGKLGNFFIEITRVWTRSLQRNQHDLNIGTFEVIADFRIQN